MPRAADTTASARPSATSRVSAVLALALLAAQMLLPWSVPRLVTQDGPSHLYSATIAWDLVWHAGSLYGSVYRLQAITNPNWATTVVLGCISGLIGVAHAEQLLMSLCLLCGFLAFQYAARGLDGVAPWSPLANFLVQTWFLWIGYYNFYLGMVLCLFVVGYYLRHARTLTWSQALLLALGGLALSLTHPVPAALTIMTLGTVALWCWHGEGRPSAWLLLALGPVTLLLLLFARSAHAPARYVPDLQQAWTRFPMQVFSTAAGPWGAQAYCWPVVLLVILAGMARMRRAEWRGPRGALAATTALCLACYFLLPDQGFGGGEAKIRFAWAIFVFGALTVSSVSRLQHWQTSLAILLFVALAANLIVTQRTARALSNVADDYLAATSVMPPGASFVRLRYHTPSLPWRYGFSGNWSDPLLHLDAYAAAAGQSIDLSDWQPANPVFSVGLNSNFSRAQRQALWSLEHPFPDGAATLRQLRQSVPIEYVVVVGEATPEATQGTDYARLIADLGATMDLVATARNQFASVYRTKYARSK